MATKAEIRSATNLVELMIRNQHAKISDGASVAELDNLLKLVMELHPDAGKEAKDQTTVISRTHRADGTPLPHGKVLLQGWMNVYRNGWFHRAGKPGNMDRQSGDFYATREAAMEHIDPPTHYIDTVSFVWEDFEVVNPNPADSEPIPLRISRAPYRQTAEA